MPLEGEPTRFEDAAVVYSPTDLTVEVDAGGVPSSEIVVLYDVL